MFIEGLNGLKAIDIQPLTTVANVKNNQQIENQFSTILVDSIKSMNNEQIESGEMVQAFLKGEGPDLHTVMINTEKANMSVEFAVQIRNKVMEAYQEIMRMQV